MSVNVSSVESVSSKNFHQRLFENILALDDFLDAVVSAEGQRIQVHRFILAAGSKYFRRLLKCNNNSSQFPIFVFNDIRFEQIIRIVQYLYTGRTQVRADELDEFFQVAKRWEILGLYHETDDVSVSALYTPDTSNFNSGSMSNNMTSTQRSGDQTERQRKRKLTSRGIDLNNSSHNTEPVSKQKSNDRKRARAENNHESKGRTVHLSKPSAPRVQPNSTTSNRNGKTVSKSNAKEINGVHEDGIEKPRSSDESNGNRHRCSTAGCGMSFPTAQELRHHKKHQCGKKREFQCRTCQKPFKLRIGLQNHYKNSACEKSPDKNQ